jgi:hypothetical protein
MRGPGGRRKEKKKLDKKRLDRVGTSNRWRRHEGWRARTFPTSLPWFGLLALGFLLFTPIRWCFVADLTRLPKAELVALVEQLAGELRDARAGARLGRGVQAEVAGWLDGLDLPPAAVPVAALVRRLAHHLDGEPDEKVLAPVAKELRAAMAEIRELVPVGDDAGGEADELEAELAGLPAG